MPAGVTAYNAEMAFLGYSLYGPASAAGMVVPERQISGQAPSLKRDKFAMHAGRYFVPGAIPRVRLNVANSQRRLAHQRMAAAAVQRADAVDDHRRKDLALQQHLQVWPAAYTPQCGPCESHASLLSTFLPGPSWHGRSRTPG